jgi:hypothetical protein
MQAPLPELPRRCDRCGMDILFGMSGRAVHVDEAGTRHYIHSPRCPQLRLPLNADLELLLKAPGATAFDWP